MKSCGKVYLPESAAHLFVVHAGLLLALSPQHSHTFGVEQAKFSGFAEPLDGLMFFSRHQQVQQKLPQLNTTWGFFGEELLCSWSQCGRCIFIRCRNYNRPRPTLRGSTTVNGRRNITSYQLGECPTRYHLGFLEAWRFLSRLDEDRIFRAFSLLRRQVVQYQRASSHTT